MISLTFLGTSGMVPTKDRNVQGIFLRFDTDGILIDCGEGTQRQMNIAGINRNDVTKVLISHWHGDHVSGLIGLIQTIGNENAQNAEAKALEIYGPVGTEMHMHHLLNSCIFDNKLDIRITELAPRGVTRFLDREKYALDCVDLEHSVPCIGYRFVEKKRLRIDLAKAHALGIGEGPALGELSRGLAVDWKGRRVLPEEVTYIVEEKTVAFILDTMVCQGCYDIAARADVLVSEAAYASDLEEKAYKHKHMTAQHAAQVASRAQVKRLIITHLSQRYKTAQDVLQDAAGVFGKVDVAYDFMQVKI